MHKKSNKEKWNKVFFISVTEDQTHRKIRSIKASKVGLIATVSTAVVIVLMLAYALLALTPLRTTIPGYPSAAFRKAAVENAIKIDSLQNAMERWKLYSSNLSKVLSGKMEVDRESVAKGQISEYLSNKSKEELLQKDSLLREKVQKEEQFGVTANKERDLPVTGIHFFTPISGVISNGFDLAVHPFVDITAPVGTIICSALAGTVVSSGWEADGGYTVIIQHQSDIVSCYKHNQKLLVKAGDKVKAGTAIALLGESGSLEKGNHLHFELWIKGEAVDPTQYISF